MLKRDFIARTPFLDAGVPSNSISSVTAAEAIFHPCDWNSCSGQVVFDESHCFARASAIGVLQVLLVQTKRMFGICSDGCQPHKRVTTGQLLLKCDSEKKFKEKLKKDQEKLHRDLELND